MDTLILDDSEEFPKTKISICHWDEKSAKNLDGETETSSRKWSRNDTMYIISRYIDLQEKFKSGKFSHKHLWNEVGAPINMSGSQCAIKFRNLKRQYMYIKNNKNKTGRGALTWPYFDVMDDIFGKRLEVASVSSVKSTPAFSLAEVEERQRQKSCERGNVSSYISPIWKRKRKEKESNSEAIINLLKEELEEKRAEREEKKIFREELREYREQDLRMKKEFLTILKDLVPKIK